MTNSIVYIDRCRSSIVINMILAIALETIAISPYLSRNTNIVIFFSIFLLWVASAFSIKKVFKLETPTKWWLSLVLLSLISMIVGLGDLNIFGVISKLPRCCIPCIGFIIIKYYNYKEKVLMCTISFFIILINILTNDYTGYLNPDIFLLFASDQEMFHTTNLGGTTLVAICLFCYSFDLFLFMIKGNKTIQFFNIISIIAISYFFFVLNTRGTAFFMFILIVLSFILNPPYEINKRSVSKLLMIFLIVCLFFYALSNIFTSLLYFIFSNNDRMIARFDDIIGLSQGQKNDEGSLVARIELAKLSISTWTDNIINFLVGIGEVDVHDQDYKASGVGHHSQIIDYLAYYGVIGTFILYKAFRSTFSFFVQYVKINVRVYNFLVLTFLVFVVYSFLNNSIIEGILFVVTVQIPLIANIVVEHNR